MPTSRLGIGYLVSAQNQPEVTVNSALDTIDNLLLKRTGDTTTDLLTAQAAADANHALIAKAHSGTQSATIFEVQGSGGGTRFSADNNGNLIAIGTATVAGLAVGVLGMGGNPLTNTPLFFGMSNSSYTSDADLTVAAAQYISPIITAVSTVSLTATRKLILPLQTGAFFIVRNLTTGAQSITAIGATGTGVTIGNGKTAIVLTDATNYYRVTADA